MKLSFQLFAFLAGSTLGQDQEFHYHHQNERMSVSIYLDLLESIWELMYLIILFACCLLMVKVIGRLLKNLVEGQEQQYCLVNLRDLWKNFNL